MNWPFRLPRILKRFARDRRGVAASEFAIISPVFIVVLFGIAGVGGAISSQFSLERKVRLAVEGVMRYGWDEDKVRAFANANGAQAFLLPAKEDGIALAVSRYRVCRSSKITEFPLILTATCPKPELWMKIVASKSVPGPFGTAINLKSRADVLAEP